MYGIVGQLTKRRTCGNAPRTHTKVMGHITFYHFKFRRLLVKKYALLNQYVLPLMSESLRRCKITAFY